MTENKDLSHPRSALWSRFRPPQDWEPAVMGHRPLVVVRGGGDLGSGVAVRLFRAGMAVVVLEIEQPLAVRRAVAFSEAVVKGHHQVEDIPARRVPGPDAALEALKQGVVPVLVDPEARTVEALRPRVLVDARMLKRTPEVQRDRAALTFGLGPGFEAGVHVHGVVETNRGHLLGRVYWQGAAQPDTGLPERVLEYQAERVLRAPADGVMETLVDIGQVVEAGAVLARVAGREVRAPFRGAVRGILPGGTRVHRGLKIGDLDPRADPSYCFLVSDKSLAIGGGVLEAILRFPVMRSLFYGWPTSE